MIVLPTVLFGFLALLVAYSHSCSGIDLHMVWALKFISWIWARPNLRGFPPKTVIFKKGEIDATKSKKNPNLWVQPKIGLKLN